MQFAVLNTDYITPAISSSPGRKGERGRFTLKSLTEDVGITDDTRFVMLEKFSSQNTVIFPTHNSK